MTKFISKTFILMTAAFLFTASTSWATYMSEIKFDYTDNGSGNYTVKYKVKNTSTDSSTAFLDFFNIDFAAAGNKDNFSNITITAPTNWGYEEAGDPTSGYGGVAGYFYADNSLFSAIPGPGLGINGTVSFSVNFDYEGTATANDFIFSYYADFGTTDTGGSGLIEVDTGIFAAGEYSDLTIYDPQDPIIPSVPEPATMVLLGLGLLGFAGLSRKNRG